MGQATCRTETKAGDARWPINIPAILAGSVGGQHSSGNFANDRGRAAEAGRTGGQHSQGGGGASHNPGNFAQDREKAAEAGRKGGQH
jgi:general stress protein YciG